MAASAEKDIGISAAASQQHAKEGVPAQAPPSEPSAEQAALIRCVFVIANKWKVWREQKPSVLFGMDCLLSEIFQCEGTKQLIIV